MIRDRSHLALDPTKKRGRFGTTASEILSPVDKNMMDFVCSLISPDRFRGNIDLQGLQVFAQTQNEILETPTPTKVIFPKSVTKDQESFAEGFQQALKQLQQQNSFVPTPTNRNLPTIYNILAAITPTLPPQNPLIPSSSASLESPLTSEADTKTSETLTLSPTAVVTSSISPLSNESGGSLINTSTCSSTSSTSGVNLAEVQRKLTGTQKSLANPKQYERRPAAMETAYRQKATVNVEMVIGDNWKKILWKWDQIKSLV